MASHVVAGGLSSDVFFKISLPLYCLNYACIIFFQSILCYLFFYVWWLPLINAFCDKCCNMRKYLSNQKNQIIKAKDTISIEFAQITNSCKCDRLRETYFLLLSAFWLTGFATHPLSISHFYPSTSLSKEFLFSEFWLLISRPLLYGQLYPSFSHCSTNLVCALWNFMKRSSNAAIKYPQWMQLLC